MHDSLRKNIYRKRTSYLKILIDDVVQLPINKFWFLSFNILIFLKWKWKMEFVNFHGNML